MAKKVLTLKKNKEFRFVYQKGKPYYAKDLILLTKKSGNSLRVGFTVSKKVGNAVKRNLVRRRLKEAYRSILEELSEGREMIFVAKKNAASVPFSDLLAQMRALFARSGAFKKGERE